MVVALGGLLHQVSESPQLPTNPPPSPLLPSLLLLLLLQIMCCNLLQSTAIQCTATGGAAVCVVVQIQTQIHFRRLLQFPINYPLASIIQRSLALQSTISFHGPQAFPKRNSWQWFSCESAAEQTIQQCKEMLFVGLNRAGGPLSHRSQLNVPLWPLVLWTDINHSV